MKSPRLLIAALLGLLLTTPAVAQIWGAICQGQDAEFNIADGAKTGGTALHTAAKANACVSAARLITKGANVHAHNKYNETPLHIAASEDAVETAELLIAYGADVNARDAAGWTPLHDAASGSVGVARLLITKGAIVDAYSAERDLSFSVPANTPLHMAALFASVEVAELLLANGANVNAHSSSGDTPLDYALGRKGYEKMIELLRAHGGGCNTEC